MVAATRGPDGPVPGDRWARRAGRFDRRSREAGAADPLDGAMAAHLRPEDVVIDVGAGAGRHVVALARALRRVVAVEPSAAMRAHLERRVAEEGLDNVEIAPDRWPSARAIAADVVLSVHVLYGVEDAPAFLLAMDAAARRFCGLCREFGLPAMLTVLRGSTRVLAFAASDSTSSACA
jgi:SAM-dependent methyltransferase